jgi:hypothetical protein
MYREVTMIQLAEVLRLWRNGLPNKPLAAAAGGWMRNPFDGISRWRRVRSPV